MTQRDAELAGSLAAAYTAFAATFRGPRPAFWNRMTLTGLSLGTLALALEPRARQLRVRGRDVATGLASAAALYGIFRIGDRMARRIMPSGASDIDSVYDLRTLGDRAAIAARLAAVIGPAEEIFWRGFVQRRLADRFETYQGAALAAAAYGGAHVVTLNPTLVGAATVAGAFWSGLSAAGASLGALIVSHAAWDVLIFLVAPTTPKDPRTVAP
ncbi:MAG TPA: CPBP family intramembrane glutamic endopeptidase [Actinomycetota bacterium]|nr:CPBP family intramembrane glutamic endopeptidase [Actinomycetota bacterium]